MKYANSKEELSKIISEIMNNTKENRYFMHNTTVGEKFYDLIDEGEGILTEKEAKEKKYDINKYDEIDLEEALDIMREYLKMSEEEILKRMEELCKCCANNIFSNGLYTETYEIRATAAHIRGDILRDKPDSKVDSELIYQSFANAKSSFGPYGYIIEVPNEKERSVIIDCEEQFILDPLHQYNKKIPTQFIKGAIFRLVLGDHTEYFFIENDRYINKDNLSEQKKTDKLSSDTKTGIESSNSKDRTTLLIGTQILENMQEIIKGEIAREVQSTQTEIGKNIEEQTQSNDIKKTGEETK